MKKINLIISTGVVMSAFMLNSCQQPVADPAAVDAKVMEAYNTQKTAVENEAATACDQEVTTKVQAIKDSMSKMSAAQQAAHLAKTQKALADAHKKAVADAAKHHVTPAVKPAIPPAKPANSTDAKLDDRFSGKSAAAAAKETDKKLDDRFTKPATQQTLEQKKEVDKKLDDRFK